MSPPGSDNATTGGIIPRYWSFATIGQRRRDGGERTHDRREEREHPDLDLHRVGGDRLDRRLGVQVLHLDEPALLGLLALLRADLGGEGRLDLGAQPVEGELRGGVEKRLQQVARDVAERVAEAPALPGYGRLTRPRRTGQKTGLPYFLANEAYALGAFPGSLHLARRKRPGLAVLAATTVGRIRNRSCPSGVIVAE